jgi:hypothetical protein
MRPIRAKPNYVELPEFKLAADVGELVRAIAVGTPWSPQWLWVQTRLLAEAESLTRSLAEGYRSDFVAEWALGLGACRNAALMSDYILTFLRDQGIVEGAKVNPVLLKLDQLVESLQEVSQDLRTTLTTHRRAQLI